MQRHHLFAVLIFLVLTGWVVLSMFQGDIQTKQSSTDALQPVASITHGHGLAVDVENVNKLYIATHHGLLLLKDDKELYSIGQSKDDYMGFSKHPTNSKTFFSSGHPQAGGNMGFLKSIDGGITWKKVSDGSNGPVDFHAMTVSPKNPKVIYGWYRGNLQITKDEGKIWEEIPTSFVITSLHADPHDENTIYATSPQTKGIMKSIDGGKSWESLSEQLSETNISAMAIGPSKSNYLLAFSGNIGLQKSEDNGATWSKIDETFGGEEVLHSAIANQDPKIVYALTHRNSLYKSNNEGETWKRIR